MSDDDKQTPDDDEDVFLDEFEDELSESEPSIASDDLEDDSFDFDDEDDDSFALDDDGFELEDDSFDDDGDLTAPVMSGDGEGPSNKTKTVVAFMIMIASLFGLWQAFGMFFSDKTPDVAQAPEEQTTQVADAEDNGQQMADELDGDLQDLFASEKDPMQTKAPEPMPMMPEVAQAPEPMAMPEPEPAPAPEPKIIQQKVDLAPLQKQLADYNDSMNTRLRRLESSLRNVTDDLDDINRHLGNVGDQVGMVNHLMKDMSDQFHTLGDSAETDRSMMAREESYVNPSLHVHAIIPGRAWLKKRDGGILTVTEGDLVGEYGKVLAIDAPSGAVVTSSGTTLR